MMKLIYTDIEEMPATTIIRIWEYFATIGLGCYGVLWILFNIVL